MLEIKNTVYFRFFDITVAILNRNIHAGQINTNVFNVWGDNLFNVISTVAWKIQIKVRFVFLAMQWNLEIEVAYQMNETRHRLF